MTLDLFSPWELRQQRHTTKWQWDHYKWKPEVGLITQQNSELGYDLNVGRPAPSASFNPDRRYVMFSGSFLYIQAINLLTEEALLYSPQLPEAPWVNDEWYLVDYYQLEPPQSSRYNEQQFRAEYPEKPCPYPIVWGKFRDDYNRSQYEWRERERREKEVVV